MPMTVTNLTEKLNLIVNEALANLGANATTGPTSERLTTVAQIATALTNAATAVTALSGVTHDRTIQDPGSALNPSQP